MKTNPIFRVFICLMMTMVHFISQEVFSQVTYAPGISWKSVDYIAKFPTIQNSQKFNEDTTELEESAEDWWYDHQPIVENGQVVGYIACGYSQIMNWGFDETPNGGCYNSTDTLQTPELCDKLLEFAAFNQGVGRKNATTMQTIARFDLYGKRIWFKTYNEFAFQHIIQTSDSNFVAIGATFSTLNPYNQSAHLEYNPDQEPGKHYYFNIGSLPCPTGSRKANVVKINGNGNVIWQYLYGMLAVEPDPNACAAMICAPNDIVEYDICNSPKLRITGIAGTPGANPADGRIFMIDIDGNGNFNWAQDYPPVTGISSGWAIGKTGDCTVSRNTETIIVAGFEEDGTFNGTVPGSPCKVMAFDGHTANPTPIWERTIPDQSVLQPGTRGNAYDMVERRIGSNDTTLLLPVIYDCSNCQGSIGRGEAAVYEINPLTGDIISSYPITSGVSGLDSDEVYAYDLKVGITNTPDNGFAIATSKRPIEYDSLFSTVTWFCDGDTLSTYNDPNHGSGYRYLGYWNSDACVRKYDINGALEWEKIFDIDDLEPQVFPGDQKRQECLYSICNAPDGGLVIAGNNSRNFDDCYLVKLFDNCNNEHTYDIEPDDISVSPVISVDSLPSNPLTGNHTIRGSIVVANGEVLTIEADTLQFADTRKCGFVTNITVKAGGQLYINSGSVLTSLEDCGFSMWDGIQVQGNPDTSQSPSFQGLMFTKESSVIANARAGTLVDIGNYIVKENENPNNDQHIIKDLVLNQHGGGGGGILKVTDSTTYLNCRKSIVFSPYFDPTYPSNPNISKIDISKFICNAPVKDYDAVDAHGNRTGVNSFLSFWGVRGLSVLQNQFINTQAVNFPITWESKGTMLTSYDAYYIFNDNNVEGTTIGISSGASNPLNTFWVQGNTFSDLTFGIDVRQVDLATIIDNTIEIGSDASSLFGIYLENCTGYWIENNAISLTSPVDHNHPSVGIVNYYSSQNDFANEIYRNSFDSFYFSTVLQGHHYDELTPDIDIGLQLRCNDFSNYLHAQAVSMGPGIAGHQGTFDVNTNNDLALLANNIFRDSSCQGIEGQIYNPSGRNPISQYQHSLNNTANNEFVVPVSGCYTISPQVVPQVDFHTFDYPTNCPDLRPQLRLTANSNLMTIYRDISLEELHDAQARVIGDSISVDSSSLMTKILLATNNVVRFYLADTSLTNSYDSIYNFLTSLPHYNIYQAKCAGLLAGATSPAYQTSSSLTLNNNLASLFSLQNYIANNSTIFNHNCNSNQTIDSLIASANDSTWFGSSSLRSWLNFNEIKQYPPVIVLPDFSYQNRSISSIEEKIANRLPFTLYPNPANNVVTVQMKSLQDDIEEIILRSLDGRVIFKKIVSDKNNVANINLKDISAGLYLIEVRTCHNYSSGSLFSVLR